MSSLKSCFLKSLRRLQNGSSLVQWWCQLALSFFPCRHVFEWVWSTTKTRADHVSSNMWNYRPKSDDLQLSVSTAVTCTKHEEPPDFTFNADHNVHSNHQLHRLLSLWNTRVLLTFICVFHHPLMLLRQVSSPHMIRSFAQTPLFASSWPTWQFQTSVTTFHEEKLDVHFYSKSDSRALASLHSGKHPV